MHHISQIGCGYWGPNLIRNMIANPRCWVDCLCDLSRDRREYVKHNYPAVNTTTNYKKVLANQSVDAIVIATPVSTHYDLAVESLNAGKHILVEKPMATTIKEVRHIRDLAAEKGLVAMAGHTFLYNPAVLYLKKMIDSGDMGELRYISSQRLNLGRIRSDVDALWNFAPHDISIIQFLLDEPEPLDVFRFGMDYVQPSVEDVVFLHIKYPGKVMAQVHVSWLDPKKTRRMTIVGSKRMAVYDDVREDKIAVYDKGIDKMAVLGQDMDFDSPDRYTFTYRSGDVVLPRIDLAEPLKIEIDHFLDCIEGKAVCRTGADHAMGVIRILESARNGHGRRGI